MQPFPLLALLLLVVPAAPEPGRALSEEDKRSLLAMHNAHRAQVAPPAADMLKMSWDPKLEKLASSYAAECKWEHNQDRGPTGENLYLASAPQLDMKSVMELWYSEYKNYDYATLSCKEGTMCGHYTQVVWATSGKVGCGAQFCEKVKNEKPNQFLVVCNYEPPGNYEGRKPYTQGAPCSKCPAEHKCLNSLCGIPSLAPEPSVGWSRAPHSTSTPADKTDSAVGRNLPGFSYLCLLPAIFVLQLSF
ncbi:peptidase inhibitor 16 isoform X2 [Rhinatrema bivittatum]|uniref:peptidase inhibitor 16 isoform X2 n=1 Tax=Rhinatrema bivittatum TaxID=194408 RepID=UPI00112D2048|nr:peptidase inhibitor 16 isoform X2 [Rhinatrema bivittatum]